MVRHASVRASCLCSVLFGFDASEPRDDIVEAVIMPDAHRDETDQNRQSNLDELAVQDVHSLLIRVKQSLRVEILSARLSRRLAA